jgi:hypothetical protein
MCGIYINQISTTAKRSKHWKETVFFKKMRIKFKLMRNILNWWENVDEKKKWVKGVQDFSIKSGHDNKGILFKYFLDIII